MKIYVASSWRNKYQPAVVHDLAMAEHTVYDFRRPEPGNDGFAWSAINADWERWSPASFRKALESPIAVDGFNLDANALRWCEACVLVLPCGRSAHLELGWAAGAGKRTIVYAPELPEPELMYLLTGGIALTMKEVLDWLGPPKGQAGTHNQPNGKPCPFLARVLCRDCGQTSIP